MQFNTHQSVFVSERVDISFAKREIRKLSESIGLTEEQIGKIDIIVTEISSNFIKHGAIEGQLLFKITEESPGIEIIGVDNGPGMKEPKRMLQDGVSTFGSNGEGLGAIKRLSNDFDLYSKFGIGTVILSRINVPVKKSPLISAPFKTISAKSIIVPLKGEILCGDGAAIIKKKDKFLLLALDGLGHGKDANQAIQTGIDTLTDCGEDNSPDILRCLHVALKKTRGAVGSITTFDEKKTFLNYCGIGNLGGKIISSLETKSLISYNGTIGYTVPRTMHENNYLLEDNSIIILHSDGLKTRWELSKYPELARHDASTIAAMLFKDNTRKSDDSMVLVVKSNNRNI